MCLLEKQPADRFPDGGVAGFGRWNRASRDDARGPGAHGARVPRRLRSVLRFLVSWRRRRHGATPPWRRRRTRARWSAPSVVKVPEAVRAIRASDRWLRAVVDPVGADTDPLGLALFLARVARRGNTRSCGATGMIGADVFKHSRDGCSSTWPRNRSTVRARCSQGQARSVPRARPAGQRRRKRHRGRSPAPSRPRGCPGRCRRHRWPPHRSRFPTRRQRSRRPRILGGAYGPQVRRARRRPGRRPGSGGAPRCRRSRDAARCSADRGRARGCGSPDWRRRCIASTVTSRPMRFRSSTNTHRRGRSWMYRAPDRRTAGSRCSAGSGRRCRILSDRRAALFSAARERRHLLQNIRFDLLRLRSAGVQSAIDDVATATQRRVRCRGRSRTY